MVSGLPKFRFSDHLCRNCVAGKQNRSSFPNKSEYRASKKLQLIHGDICGPIQPSTVGGRRYYFLLIDDYSRLMWVAFLKEKSEEFQHFKSFKNLAKSEVKRRLSVLELTEEVSLIQRNLMFTVKKMVLKENLLHLIHHNRRVWLKERIGQSCPV